MADKYTVITIAAIITIIAPLAYSGLNILAAQNIKFGWADEENFSLFEFSNNGDILVCNSSPLPLYFKEIRFAMFFEGNERGEYVIAPSSLDSGENVVNGVFRSQHFAGSQYFLMEIDSEITGGSQIRHDLRQFVVQVQIDTPILGLVPYTTTHQYDIKEFVDMMEENTC